MNEWTGYCKQKKQHLQSTWAWTAWGLQEIVHSFYDQKGEPGPKYKELHRPKKGLNL